jgi:uncharacterized protein YdeI (YjbR/CyaY-like superfamily)
MSIVLSFADRSAFRDWLVVHGGTSGGVWVLFRKTASAAALSASDALEEALCHGWIDGRVQSIDGETYKKYFARRRPASRWSAKNRELATALMDRGLMTQPGLDAVERAKKCGSWDSARPVSIDDHQRELFKTIVRPHEPAYTNLLRMSASVQRTYTGYYFEAKTPDSRLVRLKKIVDRLNRNLKPM